MEIDTTYRAQGVEMMDDFLLEGNELREALDKLADINKLLGGNKLTLSGVRKILKGYDKTQTVTIIDIGCGNGDMLRMLARYGKQYGYNFKLIGVDANAFTINHAVNLSSDYQNISYECINVFEKEFGQLDYDIALCTLTLHHFSDNDIVKLLQLVTQKANLGVVINDLHRSKLAYRLFKVICTVFRLNRMSKEDGLVSIRKGFKKNELLAFSKTLGFKNFTVCWRWAFRYEWIIYNI
jgi:2-polyprenyl-3-methyl-5-hydroxy-6-metoxy-1,4-benzoquinol methylase